MLTFSSALSCSAMVHCCGDMPTRGRVKHGWLGCYLSVENLGCQSLRGRSHHGNLAARHQRRRGLLLGLCRRHGNERLRTVNRRLSQQQHQHRHHCRTHRVQVTHDWYFTCNINSEVDFSDHIDYTISRYRSQIRRAHDIVAAIYRTISCTNARLTRALLTYSSGGVWLMSLAVHTVRGSLCLTFPAVDLSCSTLGAWGGVWGTAVAPVVG